MTKKEYIKYHCDIGKTIGTNAFKGKPREKRIFTTVANEVLPDEVPEESKYYFNLIAGIEFDALIGFSADEIRQRLKEEEGIQAYAEAVVSSVSVM